MLASLEVSKSSAAVIRDVDRGRSRAARTVHEPSESLGAPEDQPHPRGVKWLSASPLSSIMGASSLLTSCSSVGSSRTRNARAPSYPKDGTQASRSDEIQAPERNDIETGSRGSEHSQHIV